MDFALIAFCASPALLFVAGLLLAGALTRRPKPLLATSDPLVADFARQYEAARRSHAAFDAAVRSATAWKIAPVRARVRWPAAHWIRT